MAKEIGILVIHGMGSQTPQYAEPMIAEVNRRLEKQNVDVETIAWEPVFWSHVTEQNELRYLRNVAGMDLDFMSLRKFIVKAFGDAVAYQKVDDPNNHTYAMVNEEIANSMSRLHEVLGGEDKPLIIMAHSLGCVVMSNYIWDNRNPQQESGFMNFDTMARVITFGSNLPLFSFAHNDPKAIDLPDGCIWNNYYDTDDVLGYPLKPISRSYERAVTEDIEINVGSIIGSWNPMSHSSYWTDNDFTKAVAAHIGDVLA
ncbi:MAG: hypothetical protein RIG77_25715 [Cyclobacteriaceae bacterium]